MYVGVLAWGQSAVKAVIVSTAMHPRVRARALSPKQHLRQRMRPVAEHAVLHLRGTQAKDGL